MRRLFAINDPLLAELFVARNETERDCALERIVIAEARPLIRRVLSGLSLRPEDVEDVAATVNLHLVRRLRNAAMFEDAAISNFDGFVATLTYRTAYQLMRRRVPEEETAAESIDPRPGPLPRMESRQSLIMLWEEIRALPLPQRTALLLNLRNGGKMDALVMLVLLGIASIGGIAAVLELPPERMAAIWNGLPLDDLTIASMLGVTRQQVINLRKTGRKRLARRMKAREKKS